MEWKSNYSIGVITADQQHHEIFESMLRLEESMEKKASRDVLAKHVGEIRQLLYQHFLDEENLLQRLGYPDLPLHKEQHERIVSALTDFERTLFSSGDPQYLVTFFEDWFVRHVLDEDKSFSSFVSAAEAKQLAASG